MFKLGHEVMSSLVKREKKILFKDWRPFYLRKNVILACADMNNIIPVTKPVYILEGHKLCA